MNGVFIIAEAGINHRGDIAVARKMIREASAAGANAIKFQSFTASELASRRHAYDQYEFFRKFELSDSSHRTLASECADSGIEFLSTPFDFEKVDLLDSIGVKSFKIASCDLTNIPLIAYAAKKCKPMFISTGMSTLGEAMTAYEVALEAGCPRAVMLHCTTLYPTPYEAANLLAIPEMRGVFGENVGFSDHTIGNYACFAAVALGACVIEKHFALDKSVDGPDIPGSCSPDELAELVTGIRAIELARGTGEKAAHEEEKGMLDVARRSVFSAVEIPAGEIVTMDMLAFRRPGDGISPADVSLVAGKRAKSSISADSKLAVDMFE